MSTKILGALAATAVLLSGCGGGGGDSGGIGATPAPAPTTSAAATSAASAAPGGLYVGYYQEDPATNPEDPVPGAFILNLPANDGAFNGSMYFTYVGCQSSDVGAISGTKSALALQGNWAGTIDGQAESGDYAGTYDAATLSYSGIYNHAGGKTFRDVPGCTQYDIAPNGTWAMLAVNASSPASFKVAQADRTVTWTAASGAAMTLVYVIDPAIARSTGNPVLWQTVVPSGTSVTLPNTVSLAAGRSYVAGVAVLNGSYQRVAFGSASFTP